jgi:hypothetical protein
MSPSSTSVAGRDTRAGRRAPPSVLGRLGCGPLRAGRSSREQVALRADHVAALKANLASGIPMRSDKGALALLNSGDAELNRSVALLRLFVKQVAGLDKKYGS